MMHLTFPKFVGPTYTVRLLVLNDVPAAEGAHTLAYAGAHAHSITPGSDAPYSSSSRRESNSCE